MVVAIGSNVAFVPSAPAGPVGPVAPVAPLGIENAKTAFVFVPVLVTEAFVPAAKVVVVPTATVVGPAGPCMPCMPCKPLGKTRLRTWSGEVPLIVAP